jgi:hypothetical protein
MTWAGLPSTISSSSSGGLQITPVVLSTAKQAGVPSDICRQCISRASSIRAPQSRTYWRDTLLGAPALLQLPYDRPRPPQPAHTQGLLATSLPAPLVHMLQRLAEQLHVSLQAVLLGMLQVRVWPPAPLHQAPEELKQLFQHAK